MQKIEICTLQQKLVSFLKQGALLQISFTIVCILFSFVCYSQLKQTATKKQINIRFRNLVDSQVMELGNTYQNSFGEEYTIRNFKYYISKIALYKTGGKTIYFGGNYLINEADSNTKNIVISTSDNGFTGISFMIGVDSVYNVSGTQTGDLDPIKGMFWTWNSGYIMAKLEGTSPLSQEPNNNITLHVGGFKTGQNTARLIILNLPETGLPNVNKARGEIVIEANANKWFKGVHNIKIADSPVCTAPGKLAMLFSDNYAQMFTIASVN